MNTVLTEEGVMKTETEKALEIALVAVLSAAAKKGVDLLDLASLAKRLMPLYPQEDQSREIRIARASRELDEYIGLIENARSGPT
jgi:hypothetical protein